MLNSEYIRRQIELVATPGVWTEAAFRNISTEAERYAQERVDAALKGTLYEAPEGKHGPDVMGAKAALSGVLETLASWKNKGAKKA